MGQENFSRAMKTRTKIVLTIIAAVVYWAITQVLPTPSNRATAKGIGMSVKQLHNLYESNNHQFFDNKLPNNVVIDFDEKNPDDMATTTREDSGMFRISFNPTFSKATRVEEYLLLHEACHIAVWGNTEHGPKWRACMLGIDAQGGFREIFIDGYREKMPQEEN